MHVGGTEQLCGNVVRLIHEPHSHERSVLPIENTLVMANTRALSGAAAVEASTKLGPLGCESQSRRLCSGTAWSTSLTKGWVKPSAPRYAPVKLVCSSNEGRVRYSWSRTL